jgi:hypothetical protein
LNDVTGTLDAKIENLTFTGTATINGAGTEMNNTLVGNSGANVLTGGKGTTSVMAGPARMCSLVGQATIPIMCVWAIG